MEERSDLGVPSPQGNYNRTEIHIYIFVKQLLYKGEKIIPTIIHI